MRKLRNLKTIVIKVGTNTLTDAKGKLDTKFIQGISKQIKKLKHKGKSIILVSSGAIGAGKNSLKIRGKVRDVSLRQVCAAIGQDLLMQQWRKSFSKHRINVAQVLLTYDNFTTSSVYRNLTNAIDKLLKLGVIPIINENDVISIEEINTSFGDNDRLSALVATNMDADILIMLSDVKGLYTKNPRKYRDARLIREVARITPKIESMAGTASKGGAGGMRSKVAAAKTCTGEGITVIITDGRQKEVLTRLIGGEDLGTIFMPKKTRR